jgi:ABC-type multidrug transport system fused ATPase/permease subunit
MHKSQEQLRLFARTIWRVLLINWRVSPWLYVLQVFMTIVQGLLPLASAWLAGQLLGTIAAELARGGSGGPQPVLWYYLGAMAGISFVIGQMSFWSFYLDDIFNMRFDMFVQQQLFRKIHELDQSYYEDQSFNNLLNKINQNMSSMRSLNRNFLMAGNSLVQLLSTAAALVAFEPGIALL